MLLRQPSWQCNPSAWRVHRSTEPTCTTCPRQARTAAPAAPALQECSASSACTACGSFMWQCVHRPVSGPRHRGGPAPWALVACASGTANLGGRGDVRPSCAGSQAPACRLQDASGQHGSHAALRGRGTVQATAGAAVTGQAKELSGSIEVLAPLLPVIEATAPEEPRAGGQTSPPELGDVGDGEQCGCVDVGQPGTLEVHGPAVTAGASRRAGGWHARAAAHAPRQPVAKQHRRRSCQLQELPPPPRVAWDPGPPPAPGGDHPPGAQPTGAQARAAGEPATHAPAGTPGGHFRAALRLCNDLDDLEALLEGQRPLARPGRAAGVGGGAGEAGEQLRAAPEGQLPSAESINVPSLCAAFSTLLRLPEAFKPGGRRRLRALLARRLGPLLLARRQELDAAAPAIVLQALAALGPDVMDLRDGGYELVEALAEAALAACRLPPEMFWRQPGQALGQVIGDGTGGGPGEPAQREPHDAAPQAPQERQEQQPKRAGVAHTGPSSAEPPLLAATPEAAQPPQEQPGSPDPPSQVQQRQRPPRGQYGHTPRTYSTVLWSLAKLGYCPDEVWLGRYIAASAPWVRGFPPRDIAACAWALAVLGYRPGERWLYAALQAWPGAPAGLGAPAAAEEDQLGGASMRETGAGSGLGPGAAALQDNGRADAHSLSLLLWALWRLGVAAPGEWLDAALARCAAPRHQRAVGAAGAPFPGATCQSVGLIAYSLARMRHTPPPALRAALLEAAQPLLQRGSAQDLVLLLVGVAHWPRDGDAAAPPVPAGFLQQLCQVLLPRLSSCGAQGLVLSLSALAHLGFRPDSAWLVAHEEALRSATKTGQVNGKAAARVVAAWARLRYRPTRKVLERLLKLLLVDAGAARGELPAGRRVSARLFAEGLYGAAVLVAAVRGPGAADPDLGAVPAPPRNAGGDAGAERGYPAVLSPLLPAVHVHSLLSASAACLPYGYLDEALRHLAAWRLLRVAPHPGWLANLAAVARSKLRAAPPGVLVQLLALLAWPGWRRFRQQQPGAVWARRAGQHQRGRLQGAEEEDEEEEEVVVAAGSAAVKGTGLHVSSSLVAAVAARLCAQLEEMSGEQLASAVGALAELQVPLGRAVVRRLFETVRSRVQAVASTDALAKPTLAACGAGMSAAGVAGGGDAMGLQEAAAAATTLRGLRLGDRSSATEEQRRAALSALSGALRALVRLAAVAGDPLTRQDAEALLAGCALLDATDGEGSALEPSLDSVMAGS